MTNQKTNYFYENLNDKRLIQRSFYNIAYLIFGKKNQDQINDFKNFWRKNVSSVKVFKQGTLHDRIKHTTPGICFIDDKTGKIAIEMYGYAGANSDKYSFIKHEGTHEFCHSFVDLLHIFKANHRGGINKNGIHCENYMGMIKETDPKTNELVCQHYYGKMFNETMMDIISSIAINHFDSENNSKTVQDILNNNYNDWGNEITGYSIFTSLTRLVIAAFSNVPNFNYDNTIENGKGIFDIKRKMANGEIRQVNDFLYGIVYDQLHIEEEFDKIMGNGKYRMFCEYLDRIFMVFLNKQYIPSLEVKKIMNYLSDFLNKKLNYYKEHNIIDLNSANQIIYNFNGVWHSLEEEYNAYFSPEEIEKIAKRAGRIR